MANFMAVQDSIFTSGFASNGSATSITPTDATDHAAILRDLFSVRGTVVQQYDHFARVGHGLVTGLAASFASVPRAAGCDVDPATANQVQAACVAYDAQAKDVQTTVSTLRHVIERIDREIELRVNLCGDEARCIISDELLKTNSELVVADATLGQKQEWAKRLQDLSVKAENPAPVAQAAPLAGVRFGEYRPNTQIMERELFRDETPAGTYVREQVLQTATAPAATSKARAKR